MNLDKSITLESFKDPLNNFWQLAISKVKKVVAEFDPSLGSPVFTVEGKYTTRGWTQWTQGFQYGIPLLIFEATGDQEMLETGRSNTIKYMTPHISHFGVHDHAFNNMSTYGNMLRLGNKGAHSFSEGEMEMFRMALKVSGAVQAKRWTPVKDGGYIYSFNGPHSLFIDTMRTCRILVAAHLLGHHMQGENDENINLLDRVITHGLTTAKYAVYYGEGRDTYDMSGRVAHESVFNTNDGNYRCPNSQQGFSGFTTWTRGLSWAMLGFTELLEYLEQCDISNEKVKEAKKVFKRAALATSDFYIDHSSADGIPYWDTGAPSIHQLGKYQDTVADPYNDFEPVDSSAAVIAAQSFFRLGKLLEKESSEQSNKYIAAGSTIFKTLLTESYLSSDPEHHGLLLHSIYHRPNGWDHIPKGSKIPAGESSMWGDYHMTELCLYVDALLKGQYYTFFDHIS